MHAGSQEDAGHGN